MEKRKIMSLGQSSLVISLPKHWIQLNELKRGDIVSMGVDHNRSLVVFPSLEKKQDLKITLTIDPNEKDRTTVRKIIACYLNGYSGIRLVSKNIFSDTQQKTIRNILQTLSMRITQSDAKQIYIEALGDESEGQFKSSINRMHVISSSMCRDIFTALKNQDTNLAKSVVALDDDVDHFAFFLLRLLRNAAVNLPLANQLALDPIDCLDYQTLVQRIEHVADKAVYIANNLITIEGRNKKISKSLLNRMYTVANEALASYEKAVNALFARDIESCDEIIEFQHRMEKLEQEIAALSFSQEKDAQVVCALTRIRDSIKIIAEYAADIAEITIDQSYKLLP